MSKNSKLDKTKNKATPALGRKRDPALDDTILEATINKLAEVGFDKMTMDMVAASAKSGKATMYRRWASKGELVRDALVWMSRGSVEHDVLPDTGTLRGDLLALMKPHTADYSERKLRVLAGLGSFYTEHPENADEALAMIYGPWTEANMQLMKRAIERKEIGAKSNIKLACELIIAMTSYNVQTLRQSLTKAAYDELLTDMIIPALKAK